MQHLHKGGCTGISASELVAALEARKMSRTITRDVTRDSAQVGENTRFTARRLGILTSTRWWDLRSHEFDESMFLSPHHGGEIYHPPH